MPTGRNALFWLTEAGSLTISKINACTLSSKTKYRAFFTGAMQKTNTQCQTAPLSASTKMLLPMISLLSTSLQTWKRQVSLCFIRLISTKTESNCFPPCPQQRISRNSRAPQTDMLHTSLCGVGSHSQELLRILRCGFTFDSLSLLFK